MPGCGAAARAGEDQYVVDGAAVFLPGMVLHVVRAADPDAGQEDQLDPDRRQLTARAADETVRSAAGCAGR